MLQRELRGRKLSAFVLLAAALAARSSRSQDPSFTFETDKLQPYTPAYLGNGALSLATTPLATEPSRSFLAGVYDHTPGDVPRIVSAPAWSEMDIYNGTHWLNSGDARNSIKQYRQRLDMYDGVLDTEYRWAEPGRGIRVHVEQFVSRDRPHIAAVQVTIIPEFSGRIAVRLPLRNWPAPHRYDLERISKLDPAAQKDPWRIWYPGWLKVDRINVDEARRTLSLQATAPGTAVAVGEAVAIECDRYSAVQVHATAESADAEITAEAKPNQSYTVTKFAAIVSRKRSANNAGMEVQYIARQDAQAVRSAGWNRLLGASEQAWHTLWQSDVLVQGDPDVQRMIHSMLFYLIASTREDLNTSVGPMGLSSAGYYGHIFWDADTFMFPALVVLHPELARPMVSFRSHTRLAANENAKSHGLQGAMYPWEAGPDGAETTPRFAAQNASSENHVNGDVALAAWQYWLATGDQDWLRNHCWPILRDTADFWASRVSFDNKLGKYVIGNVVAVNESEIGVSNDPYTNAVARKNLALASTAAHVLHTAANPKWDRIAANMYLPASTSALLWFPLEGAYPLPQTRQAIEAIITRIHEQRSGAMMGTEFYPILAAQISDRNAIRQLLLPLSQPYLRSPFNVIAETPRNENTNFITGAGAFLQQFVFGYTGMRLAANGFERRYPPALPPGITQITLKNVIVRGKRETLTFSARGH